jgi:hypothetical protein
VKASSTNPSSDPAELDQLDKKIEAAAPPLEPAAAAGQDGAGEAASSDGPDVARTLDQLGENPDVLGKLTQEDVREMIALPFAIVAVQRGEHWKLPAETEEAALIGKWVWRAVERHGWNAVASWMPDVLAVALLVNAIAKRVQLDKAKKTEPPAGPRPVP